MLWKESSRCQLFVRCKPKVCNLAFVITLQVCAIASWDSSLHDSPHLNRVTPASERIYMVVKAVVRLSHPASMELVLRKRVAINIYKKQSLTSLTHMLKNRIIGSVSFVKFSSYKSKYPKRKVIFLCGEGRFLFHSLTLFILTFSCKAV